MTWRSKHQNTMTNPKSKVHALPPKPTEEDIKKQQARFIMQQRGAVAQSAVNSIVGNPSFDMKELAPADVVAYALELADEYIEQVYGFALTKPEDKEGE